MAPLGRCAVCARLLPFRNVDVRIPCLSPEGKGRKGRAFWLRAWMTTLFWPRHDVSSSRSSLTSFPLSSYIQGFYAWIPPKMTSFHLIQLCCFLESQESCAEQWQTAFSVLREFRRQDWEEWDFWPQRPIPAETRRYPATRQSWASFCCTRTLYTTWPITAVQPVFVFFEWVTKPTRRGKKQHGKTPQAQLLCWRTMQSRPSHVLARFSVHRASEPHMVFVLSPRKSTGFSTYKDLRSLTTGCFALLTTPIRPLSTPAGAVGYPVCATCQLSSLPFFATLCHFMPPSSTLRMSLDGIHLLAALRWSSARMSVHCRVAHVRTQRRGRIRKTHGRHCMSIQSQSLILIG